MKRVQRLDSIDPDSKVRREVCSRAKKCVHSRKSLMPSAVWTKSAQSAQKSAHLAWGKWLSPFESFKSSRNRWADFCIPLLHKCRFLGSIWNWFVIVRADLGRNSRSILGFGNGGVRQRTGKAKPALDGEWWLLRILSTIFRKKCVLVLPLVVVPS